MRKRANFWARWVRSDRKGLEREGLGWDWRWRSRTSSRRMRVCSRRGRVRVERASRRVGR